ncbi:hypothetical protein CR513_30088, partial [Mucuna pruriens]
MFLNFYDEISELVAHLANSIAKYEFFMEWIGKTKEKLKGDISWDNSKQITLPSINHTMKSSDKLLSPLQVRNKGHPPSKRKESKIEKIIKTKMKRKSQFYGRKEDNGQGHTSLSCSNMINEM